MGINTSMDPMHSGPQQNGNDRPRPRPEAGNFAMGNGNNRQNLNGGYFPVQGGEGEASGGHSSMVPEVDMDELVQHGSQRGTRT